MRRAVLAAAACLALGIAGQAAAEPRSSLPWVSGVSSGDADAFARWRGQPVDLQVGWIDDFHGSWEQLAQSVEDRTFGPEWRTGAVSMGVPMLTDDTRGRFDRCAAGEYDGYVRRIATALREKFGTGEYGRPIILRLGWEAVQTTHYPWFGADDPEGFKACFRRQAIIYSRTYPGSLIEMAHNKGGLARAKVMWPGSDVVQISGTHFYGRSPNPTNEAEWNAFVNSDKGPNAWLRFARERGVLMAVAEWGVCNCSTSDGSGSDNAFFIEKMGQWFAANARNGLFYEAYFNRTSGKYAIYPPPSNPRAAEAYRRLWGGNGRTEVTDAYQAR